MSLPQSNIIDQIADERDELRDENIRLKNRIKLLEEYETRLSAVMPIDFKDWHQNSKAEWPEVAALVISSQRERLNERDELYNWTKATAGYPCQLPYQWHNWLDNHIYNWNHTTELWEMMDYEDTTVYVSRIAAGRMKG